MLYLRGVSTGDFQEALTALLGADAPNLSPGVISRLTAGWQEEYDRWQRRDLSARRYVYIWADGSTCRPGWSPGRMHAGDHRGDAGGQQGTGRCIPGDEKIHLVAYRLRQQLDLGAEEVDVDVRRGKYDVVDGSPAQAACLLCFDKPFHGQKGAHRVGEDIDALGLGPDEMSVMSLSLTRATSALLRS